MLSRPTRRRTSVISKFGFLPVLALLGGFLSTVVFSQPSPTALALEQGKSLERDLNGSLSDSYALTLHSGQYIKIEIKQVGIDIVARLQGPDGKVRSEYDSESRPSGTETIEFVSAETGPFVLRVEPRYKLLPAGKYQIRLLEIRAATVKDSGLQEARDGLAQSIRLFSAGKYDEAQRTIQTAIELRERFAGADVPVTASALTQLARVLDAQGKYSEAEKLNIRILAIRTKALGPDHPDVGTTLNYLATVNNHKEDYPTALSYHLKALAVREKAFGPGHPVVAVSLINLGVVYDSLGDKVKAADLYQKALSIQENTVGPENLNVAVILNNIGKIYDDLNEFKKAEPFLLRASAILEKLYGADNPRVFDSLTNLAECYAGQKELAKAETLYLRILQARQKTLGEDHPLTAHVLYNLANLYALTGQLDTSESFYRRAVSIREKTLGPQNPGVSEALAGLSILLARRGNYDEAFNLQQRVSAIDEQSMSVNLGIGSERQKLAYLDTVAERTNQNILMQARFAPQNEAAIKLAASTVLRQKGRVMDAMSNDLIELRRRSGIEDRTMLDDLNAVTAQLAGLILDGPVDGPIAAHEGAIKELTEKRETLEDLISRRFAGFYERSKKVSLADVQKSVPDNAALIEFTVYSTTEWAGQSATGDDRPRYAAYVIRRDGRVGFRDLGAVDEIDAAIGKFRTSLRDPRSPDVRDAGREVNAKIMEPLRDLAGSVSHLLISAEGTLNLIPFEALVDSNDNYLVENYSITYLTSGRDLLRMQQFQASSNPELIIAAPSFGSRAGKGQTQGRPSGKRASITTTRSLADTWFGPLAGTEREARSIKLLFPRATILTGAAASEESIKRAVSPRLLHIATHGFFLEPTDALLTGTRAATRDRTIAGPVENPLLRSGLAFSGANVRRKLADDGILTALEASGLNLWGTQLVVLSACDTGLGEVRNGEGVYGLRRAFTLAGAQSILMSLWPVSDYVTREMMTKYYANLKQGGGRGESLRTIQLEMLKSPDRKHPFYWASFIQSGEWANLDGVRP